MTTSDDNAPDPATGSAGQPSAGRGAGARAGGDAGVPTRILTGATLLGDEAVGASAVAFGADGTIVAVGPRGEVEALETACTDVVDVEGASVWPAFHDAHVHPLSAGTNARGCDLHDVHDLDGYRRIVTASAEALPPGAWLFGGGWFGDVFEGGLPTRALLDAWVPDRPVVLLSHDAHGAWVNSAAIEAAGIDRSTPDPHGGSIGRDAQGEPDGVLVDAAAELVARFRPEPDAAELDAAMLDAQRTLFSMGVVGWQDAIVGEYLSLPNPLATYARLRADGRLRGRVTGALWWDRARGPEQIEAFERIREACADDADLRFDAVKIMQDGICENCTGALLAPYAVPPAEATAGAGESLIAPDELAAIVTALDAAGFSVHFHGVGDRAVRECLDAVAAARAANGPSGLRHQIAHVDLVDEADVPRFAALDVIANLQPLWARADKEIVERKLPLLGADRAARHFPFGDLHAAGAALAMGSDWPVSSPDPLWGIHTAVTRTAPPGDPHGVLPSAYDEPMNPEQRLPLDVAVLAYTAGSAAANGRGATTGRLEPGLAADLVVLDGPVRDAAALATARVAATFLGGECVYEA